MNITNRPLYVEKKVYDDAINKYLSRVENLEGVISINTMGSISSPGLSDIDLIVVVEDNYQLKKSSLLSVKGIDDRLFIHGPIIIPKCLAKKIQYIIYATNVKLLYGPELLQNISNIQEDEVSSLLLCYLIDFIESRYLQFSHVALTGEIDQRAWIARLWSITHSYAIFKRLGLSLQPEASDQLNLIKKIREDWNDFKRIDDEIFFLAYNFGIELNTLMFNKALDLAYSDVCYQKNISSSVQLGNKKIYFEDISAPKYITRNFTLGNKNITTHKCHQSKKYAAHLVGYGFVDSDIDNSIKKSFHYSVMDKRKRYVFKHWQWINEHAKYSGTMSGYLGLKNNFSSGSLFSLRRMLEKLILNF